MGTILNLDITFKDKVVDKYNITVLKESVQESPKKVMQEGRPLPPVKGQSQPHRRRGENSINDFDRNNDGRVSREEFDGPEQLFNRFDRNSDGFIDADEFPQGPPKQQRQGQRRRW